MWDHLRRPVNTPADVDLDVPLVWTGRMVPRARAARRFAFSRNYRLRHVDSLTWDFLVAMAAELAEADALVLTNTEGSKCQLATWQAARVAVRHEHPPTQRRLNRA